MYSKINVMMYIQDLRPMFKLFVKLQKNTLRFFHPENIIVRGFKEKRLPSPQTQMKKKLVEA